MSQGKGDDRRPMTIDDRQLEINWDQTFVNDESNQTKIFTTTRDNPDQDIAYGQNRRFNRR